MRTTKEKKLNYCTNIQYSVYTWCSEHQTTQSQRKYDPDELPRIDCSSSKNIDHRSSYRPPFYQHPSTTPIQQEIISSNENISRFIRYRFTWLFEYFHMYLCRNRYNFSSLFGHFYTIYPSYCDYPTYSTSKRIAKKRIINLSLLPRRYHTY